MEQGATAREHRHRVWVGSDLVGAAGGATGHEGVAAMAPLLAALAEEASSIDRDGVTREHVARLAEAGWFRLTAPEASGGSATGAPPAVVREVVERLAAASGAVWFVATQHASPTRAALSTPNGALRELWSSALLEGAALGAVAFAHVRRSGPPTVRAERVPGGWRVGGRLDWLTSWGLADVVLLYAQTDDDRIVQALLPARPRDGWEVTGPLPLAAMSATATVGVRINAMHVPDDEVADVVPRQDWLAADALRTANTNPAVVGLLRAVVDDLHRLGVQRAQPHAVCAAQTLAEEVVRLRTEAYRLLDEVRDDDCLEERLALRAGLLTLAQRAAAARVAVEGGAAMTLRSPAQRWAREAMFHLVQAQTQPLREALLDDFAGQWRGRDRT